ncbi:MAG TPA: tRNA preQ1(34) S-adenosylmethionine ribosyltransferase-isomerase QueA [bacterium]|nr:tRNA preQ1(34) S-adenosylmethionine ribosyltransferase-isomerase QueA [bacterium]
MKVEVIDYDLPRHLIAQEPAPERDASRLMVCRREGGAPQHRSFSDFPSFLRSGDVLVVNDSSVYPARLRGLLDDAEGELLLLRKLAPGRYRALARPARRAPVGARFVFGADGLRAEVVGVLAGPERVVEFYGADDVEAAIDAWGTVPLPPYIKRPGGPDARDAERYQTVYARRRGSVAAPTAGLHFTRAMLEGIRGAGVDVVEVTLHVSYGTFKPIRAETFEEHDMEKEEVSISRSAARALSAAKLEGRRVVAVGTTSVRAVETAANEAGVVAPFRGETGLFIYPGYQFKAVDAVLTNFHLPRSSLLALVGAFAGVQNVQGWYRAAVAEGYRFYSYGDAMFVY